MKKIIYFLLVLSLFLSGCRSKTKEGKNTSQPKVTTTSIKNTSSNKESSKKTNTAINNDKALEFIGLRNEIVEYGSSLDLLNNVRIIDQDGNFYSLEITLTSDVLLNNHKIPSDYVGKLVISYSATYNNKEILGKRTITVLPENGNVSGENLIANGEFNENYDNWTLSNHEGANSSLSIVNSKLMVKCVSLNQSNASSPRINSKTFTLEKGKTYKFSFMAYADKDKTIQMQIGKLYDSDPWFINVIGETFKASLTKDLKEYSFIFEYKGETSNDLTLLFEMGKVDGSETITNIYYDNISICEYFSVVNDKIVPIIYGIDDKILYTNSKVIFDPLKNVKAYDEIDGDITNRLTYEIYKNGTLVDKIDYKNASDYEILYKVSDYSFNFTQKIRRITIEELTYSDENLIKNGDFSSSFDYFSLAIHEGAEAKMSVSNGMLKIAMEKVNWQNNSSSPRIANFEPFTLVEGEYYKVSFKAYSDLDKTILVQIGTLYDYDPYWIDLKKESVEVFILNQEMKEYEFIFKMNEETSSLGYITFELGTVMGDATITNVYFDDIKVELLKNSVTDYLKPVFTGLSDLYFYSNEISSYDLLTGIKAIDDLDGDITKNIRYEIYLNNEIVTSLDYTKENVYDVYYYVSDKAGNEEIRRIKVNILPNKTNIKNIFNNSNWNKNVGEEASDFEIIKSANEVNFILGEKGGSATWDVRAHSTNFGLTSGTEYILIMDIESDLSRDILLQIGRYADTSNFAVQLTEVVNIKAGKARYVFKFKANANYQDFALGFEMGLVNNSYVSCNIKVTNIMLYSDKTYLETPVGIVLNKVANGTILAFAAIYPSGAQFRLYVYNNDTLLKTYTIYNGQNLNELDLLKGSYTLKIQAFSNDSKVIESGLSIGITYIKE